MTILQSIFLGIVQGLTEFLPVSSSGHLAILQNIFHIDTDGGLLFDILLHVGTLIAVITVYHRDIWKMIRETVRMIGDVFINLHIWTLNKRHKTSLKYRRIVHNNYRKFVLLLLVSTVPTALIGAAFQTIIEEAAGTLLIPGICLLMTGVLLLIADYSPKGKKLPKDTTYKEGLIIGLVQGFAALPGLSRSGITITAGLLCGMERRFAVKYSFILSIPAVIGAAILEIRAALTETIPVSTLGIYLVGAAVAAAVGYICIKVLLVLVRSNKFRYFAYYCFAAGVLSIAGHFFL